MGCAGPLVGANFVAPGGVSVGFETSLAGCKLEGSGEAPVGPAYRLARATLVAPGVPAMGSET